MSAPVEVAIQAALCAQLKTPDLTTPVTPIAWPLVKFSPINGVSYIRVQPVMRATPQIPSIGFNGSDILTGIFQVDAVTPDNQGEAPGLTLAQLIAVRFAIGTNLTAGGRRLQIVKLPAIAAAVVEDAPWIRFPVSIPYLLIN